MLKKNHADNNVKKRGGLGIVTYDVGNLGEFTKLRKIDNHTFTVSNQLHLLN